MPACARAGIDLPRLLSTVGHVVGDADGPKRDMHALWRRIIFNILISSADDHLRNHAFLYTGLDGWRLAPACDLNPPPMTLCRVR